MSEGTPDAGARLGKRVRQARLRCGLTQKELAEQSGLSLSFVRKVEQGERPGIRVGSLRALAGVLGTGVSGLLGDDPPAPAEPAPADMWAPTREAILRPRQDGDPEPGSERGTAAALDSAVSLYHDNRYGDLAAVLPRLIRDAEDAPPLLRSRVHQLAGSVMVQTRNRDAARVSLDRSVADAEASGGELDAASAVITLCWLLTVERRFGEVMCLSAEWADRVEPRMSAATVRDLSVWGWLLLRGSAAAIRDGDPGYAADMMRLASAAAAATGREQGGYKMYWTTFGPATVAMKRAENALVDGRPDTALRIAREVPPGLRPTSDNRNRHLLDVAAAHAELRNPGDALGVLLRLRREAGAWLAEQRMARDILRRVTGSRRAWTQEMRELAEFLRPGDW